VDNEKLTTYFYSNLVTIFWSSFLLVGGGIFIAYYAHIEYMPDFDLKSSITITAAAAVTAILIISILLGIMVLPGVFWGNTWGAGSSLKKYWTDKGGNKTVRGLLIWFSLPLASLYSAAVAGFFVGWYALFLVALTFGGFFLFVLLRGKQPPRLAAKEIWTLLWTALVSAMLIFIPLWLVLTLALHGEAAHRMPAWLAGLMSGCFIIFINTLASTTPKNIKPFYWYFGLSIATLFVVLSLFGKFYRIPVKVMELYKFGNIQTTKLVLKKEACKTLGALDVEIIPHGTDICVANDILILSRLGKETYLQYNTEGHTIKFTVISDEIASWAVSETVKGDTSLAAPKPR
jgi:hypothetical protein